MSDKIRRYTQIIILPTNFKLAFQETQNGINNQ
jgi:hypothetical protein